MEHTIATSADGSNTLQLTRFNETYHSKNGAYTEATHIYIRCGLEYLFENELERCSGDSAGNAIPNVCINIFDIGLGTALNCILAWHWQQQLIRAGKPYPQIAYYGIEKYPIPSHEALQMNYPHVIAEHMGILPYSAPACANANPNSDHGEMHPLDAGEIASAFEKIHTCQWDSNVEITSGFTLHKSHADITELTQEYFCGCEYVGEKSVIFYDTFSPTTQPELWDEAIFRTISSGCASGCTLVTYCSKGTVKQALRSAGFTLERLAGPPGKRHILRATL